LKSERNSFPQLVLAAGARALLHLCKIEPIYH
jgi:hypothetical protein